jgi:hypothetical protein
MQLNAVVVHDICAQRTTYVSYIDCRGYIILIICGIKALHTTTLCILGNHCCPIIGHPHSHSQFQPTCDIAVVIMFLCCWDCPFAWPALNSKPVVAGNENVMLEHAGTHVHMRCAYRTQKDKAGTTCSSSEASYVHPNAHTTLFRHG